MIMSFIMRIQRCALEDTRPKPWFRFVRTIIPPYRNPII
jgi:hypothetical protein